MRIHDSVPLSRPGKQVRLLHPNLPTSSGDTNTSWTLKAHDLDDTCPKYIAISYMWGDPVSSAPEILVNGQRVAVRPSCRDALWQMGLHDETSSSPLWIDSLCINQEDNIERAAQVAMMGQIYESAMLVAACSGMGDGLGLLFAALRRQSPSDSTPEPPNTTLYAQLEFGAAPLNKPLEFISKPKAFGSPDQQPGGTGVAETSLMSLRDVESLPYFTRMWIIQELVLANEIRLFFGPDMITWEELEMAVGRESVASHPGLETLITWRRRRRAGDENRSQYDDYQIIYGRREWDFPQTPNMCDLLITCRGWKCSDPLDRVYALLSLLPTEDSVRQSLKVDYTRSLFSLIADISPLLWKSSSLVGRDNAVIALRLLLRSFKIGTDHIDEARAFLEQRTEAAEIPPDVISLAFKDPRYRHGGVEVVVLSDQLDFNQVESAFRVALERDDPTSNGMRHLGVLTKVIPKPEAEVWENRPRLDTSLPRPYNVEAFGVSDFRLLRTYQPSDGDGIWRLYREDSMVRGDVQHGDIVIQPHWLRSNGYWSGPPCAVFRRLGNSRMFHLHSWAHRTGATSTDFEESQRVPEEHDVPLTYFHHDDILAWALLEDWPAQALNHTPASTGASHIVFSDWDLEKYDELVHSTPDKLKW